MRKGLRWQGVRRLFKMKIRNSKKEIRITYRQTIAQRFALAMRQTVILQNSKFEARNSKIEKKMSNINSQNSIANQLPRPS